MEAVKQAVDLASGLGMAEHRQPERRLGDEDVARHRHEARTSRIGPALIVAGHDHTFALVLEHDLGGAEYVPRGHEADIDLADADRLVIADSLARLRAVAGLH